MGKFFVAAIMSVLVVVGQISFCSAMSYGEMYLGGFTVGSPYSEMKRTYGEPVQDEGHAEDNHSCHYGNSVHIGYSNLRNVIQSITVTANNGWKTPSGLAVGDNISKALDICGNADYTKSGAYKTVYCYVHRNGNKPDYGFFILFNKKSGKILELSLIGGNSMMSFDEMILGERMLERMVE